MLAGTVGLVPSSWRNVIHRMEVWFSTDTTYKFGSASRRRWIVW